MKLQDYDSSSKHRATIVQNDRLSAEHARREVHEIVLELDGSMHALPGQNVGVLLPDESKGDDEVHFRLYTIADLPERREGMQRIHIQVRRHQYFDALTGETYRGIASNFLCDSKAGDEILITGPYGQAFEIPPEPHANMILIGAGTGIAPFRAFLKHVYRHYPEFTGQVYLFYGGETGLDLLYGNDQEKDISLYYDRDTFEAIEALSNSNDPDSFRWSDAMRSRAKELAVLLSDPETFVYLAGLESIRDELEATLCEVAGSNQRWYHWKEELVEDERWFELLY
ncbi:MAG: oxidoreductase [Planctomycetota bacterium]